jgi:hypothetical protein
MAGRSERGRCAALVLATASIALLPFYHLTGVVLAGDADVLQHSSGIYDMDVARVVVDLTSAHPGLRSSVHPLQKLLVAPLGARLEALLGGDALAAARLLVALAVSLNAALVGWLAHALTGGACAAALLACLVAGVSFSSVLAASIPESAALASLGTVAPLLLLSGRRQSTFSWGEAVAWGAMLFFCIALTVTQVVNGLIALAMRVAFAQRQSGTSALRPALARASFSLALGIGLTFLGVEVQARAHPGTPRFYAEHPVQGERPFLRTTTAAATPLHQTGRLAAHFLVIDFAAPLPAYSDFLLRDWGIQSWSLSAEEAGASHWRPAQRALAALLLAMLGSVVVWGRWRDANLVAPAACLAFHFALHLVYGREYVLYSPHWHGVGVAMLVAAGWNGALRRRAAGIAVAALCLALVVNDVVVMRAVYREVAHGLGADVRDVHGRPVPPAPGTAP